MSKIALNHSTTTFRLAFRISHSLPLSGEVEKHGHSMFLELCFENPLADTAKLKAILKQLEKQWDGAWIDDFFTPATSENFLLFLYKKIQQDFARQNLPMPIHMALQETIKNRFILKTV